ncbi:MAG: sigma factor [Candidatus Limnocylindrales bacterium]
MEAEQRSLTGVRTRGVATRMGDGEQQRMLAFRQLADQRLDASYRLATAILGDGSQSQDAVHDAVLLAWERWSSLRDQAKFDAWFDRIVVNVRRERLRRSARRPSVAISGQVLLGAPDPAPEVSGLRWPSTGSGSLPGRTGKLVTATGRVATAPGRSGRRSQ